MIKQPPGICSPLQLARVKLLAVRILRDPRGRLLSLLVLIGLISAIFVVFALTCDDPPLIISQGEKCDAALTPIYIQEEVHLLEELDYHLDCESALGSSIVGKRADIDWTKVITKIDPPYSQAEPKQAYVTVASDDIYVRGAIALMQSIKMTGTNRDLVVIHNQNVSASYIKILQMMGVKTVQESTPDGGTGWYKHAFLKFKLWHLVQYEKVAFFDADSIVLKNMDILFLYPEPSATIDPFNQYYWDDAHIHNSAMFVAIPSRYTYDMIMNVSRYAELYETRGWSDGRTLHRTFKNGTGFTTLPVSFLVLSWMFEIRQMRRQDLLNNAKAIHYSGSKPWFGLPATCCKNTDFLLPLWFSYYQDAYRSLCLPIPEHGKLQFNGTAWQRTKIWLKLLFAAIRQYFQH